MRFVGASCGRARRYADRSFASAARKGGSEQLRNRARIPRIQGFHGYADWFVLAYSRERGVRGLLQD
jgi:hypothetical protein